MSRPRADVLIHERRPLAARVVVVAGAMLTATVIAWAAITVTSASTPTSPVPTFVTATATRGSVEDSLPVRAVATWTQRLVARNAAQGIVTSVDIRDDRPTEPGDELYSVDLAPVIVGAGHVPAFRTLSEGDVGMDVKQLQGLLRAIGILRGPADGVFGRSTREAVVTWQRFSRIEPTGVVPLGSVVFVPTLPATLRADSTALNAGAPLSGGEPVVQQMDETPTISASLPSDAVGRVTAGSAVRLSHDAGDELPGRVGSVEGQSDGSSVAQIQCEEGRSLIPPGTGPLPLRGSILVVPRTRGVIVPTAAIRSSGRSVSVIDDDGVRHRVDVLASVSGRSVVRGVHVGTRVRISDERG